MDLQFNLISKSFRTKQIGNIIWPIFSSLSRSAVEKWIKDRHGHWEVSLFPVYMDCMRVSILGTYTLQSAVVMKCLSLRATFVTVSQSGRQTGMHRVPLIEETHMGLLSKGSFHARLDTSVIGHGAGFHCLSIELHMECVHTVKTDLEIKCLPLDWLLFWSLPHYKLKIPSMQWIKASVMTEVMVLGNFYCLWLHAESLFTMCSTYAY